MLQDVLGAAFLAASGTVAGVGISGVATHSTRDQSLWPVPSCPHCGGVRRLSLVPLVGAVAQGGTCPACDARSHRLLPLFVQVLVAVLFVFLYGQFGLSVRLAIACVETAVTAAMENASWLLLCGSIPPGVPDSFYGKLVAVARQKKVKTLVRANGEALREAIDARPTVAAPNQTEAERLLGRTLLTRTHYLEAAERLRAMGPESVVLSLGSRGAVGAYADGLLEALPPRIDAVCPIGAGDAFTAAYAWAMRNKGNHAEALRWGVAAGTASARLPGMQMATLAQSEEVYRKVEVRRAE